MRRVGKPKDKACDSTTDNCSCYQHLHTLAESLSLLHVNFWRNYGEVPKLFFRCFWLALDGATCLTIGLFVLHLSWYGTLALVLLSNTWVFVLALKEDIRKKLLNWADDRWHGQENFDAILNELAKTKQV